MEKKYSKIIILLVVFLTIASIVILLDNLSSKKEVGVNSRYYAGFVSSVQRLDGALAKTNKTEYNGDIVQMFDVYTSIIFLNDRLSLWKERTNSFPSDLDTLTNDFMIFRHNYGSFVRHQIVRNRDYGGVDSEVQLIVVNQIKLFLNDLPKEYEDSKEFSNQLNVAAKHIKPLLHLNF